MNKVSINKAVISIILLIIVFGGIFHAVIPSKSKGLNKIAQISFDDVYLCLKDLRDNEYKSIFDQPFLGYLRSLHDKYGASFELYVYEKAADFTIDQVPNRFKKEFSQNSNWLKWGFHATSPEITKSEQSKSFVKSMYKVNSSISMWGGEKLLSNCLRLHYFYANDSMISCLKRNGILYLLGADDKRISYNLKQAQSDSLYFLRKYINNGMVYYKTDLRIEKMNFFPLELLMVQNQDSIIIFTHEWALKGLNKLKFNQTIKWLHNNGYRIGFK